MRAWKIAVPAVAIAAVSCQPQAEAPASLSQEDVTAIREFAAAYRDAALAQDFESLAALYTPDGVRNPPNAPPAEASPSSLRAGYQGVTELENAPDRIEGRGDLAHARGSYSITVASEGVDAPISDTGHYVAILRKQEDGRWLMSYLIFNSDQPPPQAQAEQ